MTRKTNQYTSQETLFSNKSTLIQRAIRECDGVSVILKSLVLAYPTQNQLRRFSFSYDVSKKFDHPNISKVLDYQEQNNTPFMVFEDHQSIDLRKYTQQQVGKCLPLDDFLTIAIQLAEALSVIHHAQVIHKDLNPGNLLINPQTLKVQVIGFGLASILTREQPALASPEKLEGLLPYISPEQTGRMNRTLDYRTDFYTLGVTFYELLSGQLPFEASDALGVVHAHIAKIHKPLNQLGKDIPDMVSKLIDKLLNKSAEERYQSALGLKADLEKCLQALQKNRTIENFELGDDDISDRFQISQKLYGRSTEVNTLLQHFNQVTDGHPKLLSVSGYSGVGKSVLINEVHKPIAAHNGLFLSGKFDQFQRSTPYFAFKQALTTWLLKILSLPEHHLAAYREDINAALGVNARVLIDIMVEFKPLLGELPEVPVLGADEAQNRLNSVLLNLVAFIAGDKPLVIFIDDLQWADLSSLNLLTLLMREADCALLVIVAYRDNEVDDTHPAMQALNLVRDFKSESIAMLSLAPLCLADTEQLITDSLHCSIARGQSLVELVHQKTNGNPFFINQFLKTLYSENLLNFDLAQHCWQWNIDAIVEKGITDNVVELMLRKMQQLLPETQQMLQLSSCIGNSFDLELLSVIAEQAEDHITGVLWPAVQEGLIFQARVIPDAEKKESLLSTTPLISSTQFKFLHDRMLQAAFESVSVSEQQQTHLKIGRILRARYFEVGVSSSESQSSALFSVVESLNLARSLISDDVERLHLAELNQQAADIAKSSSAWDAVVQYANVGMSLLPNNRWQTCYQLTFNLLQLKAQGEYLCGHPEASDRLYSELLQYCHKDLLKAEVYATRAIENSGRGLWYKGVGFCLQGLASLGMPLLGPTDAKTTEAVGSGSLNKRSTVNDALLVQEQALFDEQIKRMPVEKINQLPEMDDPRKLVSIKILSTLTVCTFLLGNFTLMRLSVLRGLNLVLAAGKSDLTGSQLAWFSALLVQNREYMRSVVVAKQAMSLLKNYPHAKEQVSSYNILACLVLPMKDTFEHSIKLHQKAYEIGLESGEIVRAIMSLNNLLFLNYSSGKPLSLIKSQAFDVISESSRKKVFAPHGVNVFTLVKALSTPSKQAEKSFEFMFLPDQLKKIKGSFHEYALLHFNSELAFWYGDRSKSLEMARNAHDYLNQSPRFCFYMDHFLQYGLLLIADLELVIPEESNNDVRVLGDDITFCLEELKNLAEFCPANFGHKYQLLLAEKGAFQNAPMASVAKQFKKAIESAKENGFIQYQALGNELFALYLNNHNLVDAATAYLEEAVYLYQCWGCKARILYLKKNYDQLLPFLESVEGNHENTSTEINSEKHVSTDLSADTSKGSQLGDESGLDFESVMKSSQIISSELELTTLAQKIMGILTESAGAQTAALILNTPKGPCVQARIPEYDGSEIVLPQLSQNTPKMLAQCLDLPRSIISYALRTDKVVNIEDVSNNSSFDNEPYLKSQSPQSILCVPVEYREKTIGMLYLENKLTSKAFTKSRLDVIKILLSQAAISIENARLFENVNLLTQGLEQQVTERTEALSESNEALQVANEELNAFSYSVSHDLRSPLRTMKGFSQILLSEYTNTLDSMGVRLLQRIKLGSSKMGDLINGLLELSRVQGQGIELSLVNLSDIANEIVNDLNENNAERTVEFICGSNIQVQGDERMLSSVMVNLLNNAWKYSAKKEHVTVEFGHEKQKGKMVYFVKDNGAGFDMENADTLFSTFARMHTEKEFSGTGIGLATVKRIINRHKGEIWAEAEKDKGAAFYFTL